MKQFDSVPLTLMTQDESFQFHTVVYGYFKDSTLIETSSYELLYGSAIEEFDIALKQVRESEKTVKITTIDKRRDVLYRGAVKTNAAAMHHFTPDIASAAHAVDIVFRNYGDPTKLPYPAETSVIYNLCQELQTPTYAPLLVKLGLTEWIEELKLENEAFDKMYNDRSTEQSVLLAGLARTKRHNVEVLYRSLIRRTVLCLHLWISSTSISQHTRESLPLAQLVTTIEKTRMIRMATSQSR